MNSAIQLPLLSHSQRKTFEDCPYQWYLQKKARDEYGNRLKPLTAGWFHHGTAVHAALEQWELSNREIDAVAVYYREYDSTIERYLESHPYESEWLRGGRKSRSDDVLQRRELGAEQVRWFVEWAPRQDWRPWRLPDPYDAQGPVAAEVEFRAQLGGVMVRGIADAAWELPDGRVVVVDYKTGTRPPDDDEQLGLYALALSELCGAVVAGAGYLMMREKRLVPADLTRYTRQWLTDAYASTEKGIAAGKFPARPGGCFTCTMKKHCEYAS